MSRRRSRTRSSYRSSSAPAPLWSPDQSILDYVVNDCRLREEVVGNRLEIVVAQIFEAVLDGLPHRAVDLALLGRDVGHGLTVRPNRCPGQPLVGSHSAEEIARGMALAAMPKRSD